MMVSFTRLRYNKTYIYPWWAEACGMTLAIIPMLLVPAYLLKSLASAKGKTWKQVGVQNNKEEPK